MGITCESLEVNEGHVPGSRITMNDGQQFFSCDKTIREPAVYSAFSLLKGNLHSKREKYFRDRCEEKKSLKH